MPDDHERDCRFLLFGERQELRRKFAQRIAIELHKISREETVQDRE